MTEVEFRHFHPGEQVELSAWSESPLGPFRVVRKNPNGYVEVQDRRGGHLQFLWRLLRPVSDLELLGRLD